MSLLWTPSQLAVLAKVVDLNGFSAAARALGVPKAAVSRAVADLERALGVKVLERTTRRISLTHAGRLLYPNAKRIVDESDAARGVIARLNAPGSGPLRVVADPTYGRVLLTPLVVYHELHAPTTIPHTTSKETRSPQAELSFMRRRMDFGAWSDYVSEIWPALLIRVTPRFAESFWAKVGRIAAETQGVGLPAFKHYKSGFVRLRALCVVLCNGHALAPACRIAERMRGGVAEIPEFHL